MKISTKEWILFVLIAIFCFGLWSKFGYPWFFFVDLSINKKEALLRAEKYLDAYGVNIKEYSKAIVFDSDDWADRYLQKTIGLEAEEGFISRHNYELFSWIIRFFKQLQKEEFVITISPKTGEVLSFDHLIEDIESRPNVDKNIARQKAEEFLKTNFGIDLENYDFHEEKIKRYEKRIDYGFSWEKKNVYIPWKKDEGGAKLLIGATVSGNEIRQFYKNRLDVPEKFRRYIDRQVILGEYLSSFYFLVFAFLITASIYVIIKRRSNVITRFCKKWFLYLAIFFIILSIIDTFNNIQIIIIGYPTSASLMSFISIYLVKAIIHLVLFSVAFIICGIAGESLHNEVFKEDTYSSFLHFLRSTFYSRVVTRGILFGYVLFFILIGLQAGIFYLGQKYLGVWREWFRFTQFSSAYLPFLSAFTIGVMASLNEEVLYRLFGISWSKKYLKNTILAVVFTSLIWGFGHSKYPIFPVWFRGIEVSLMGLVLGFIFIKYGLIPVIVTHYLFDVFWGTAAYILGHSTLYLFASSVFILLVPLIIACIAYFVNKKETEQELKTMLDDIQKYNLGILITFVSAKRNQGYSAEQISKELIIHNWDIELIDLAIKECFKV